MTGSGASGCAWDGPMSTVVRGSDFNRAILRVYTIITWATGIIGLVVFVVLGYILMRFRRPPDTRLPAQIRGNTLLELGWTIMPAIVLLVIAIPTIQIIFRTQTQGAPAGALRVTVRAWQWWWGCPGVGCAWMGEEARRAGLARLPSGR